MNKILTTAMVTVMMMVVLSGCGEKPTTHEETNPTGLAPVETSLPTAPVSIKSLEYKYSKMNHQDVTLMMSLINGLRAEGTMCGDVYMGPVGPLKWDEELSRTASVKNADMIDNEYFAHEASTPTHNALAIAYGDKTQWQPDYALLIRGNAGWRASVGENIAGGFKSTQSAFDAWLASPGHCENMMQPFFTTVGYDFSVSASSDFGHYATQHFSSDKR